MPALGEAPAAPTRRRQLASNRPTASSNNNNQDLTEQLADDLTSLSLQAETPSSRSRPGQASSLVRRVPPSKTNLPVNNRVEGRTKEGTQIAPGTRWTNARVALKEAIETLQAIAKSEWKANQDSKTTAASKTTSNSSRQIVTPKASTSSLASTASNGNAVQDQAVAAAKAGNGALAELRELIVQGHTRSRPAEVERLAGSLVHNLVAIGPYAVAMSTMDSMRASILSWYCSPTIPKLLAPKAYSPLAYVSLVSLPLTDSDFFVRSEATSTRPTPAEVVPLALALQQYALDCLFRSELGPEDVVERANLLDTAFKMSGNALEWKQLWDELEIADGAAQKRVEALMANIYRSLRNGCVGLDDVVGEENFLSPEYATPTEFLLTAPEILLSIRSYAHLVFASARAVHLDEVQLDSFHVETRQILVRYMRRAQELSVTKQEINQGVKIVFWRVVTALDEAKVAKAGKGWESLCRMISNNAKEADDLLLLRQITDMLGLSDEASDPEAFVDQTCDKLVLAQAELASFWKSGHDIKLATVLSKSIDNVRLLMLLISKPLSPVSRTRVADVLRSFQASLKKQIWGKATLDSLVTLSGKTQTARFEGYTGTLEVLDVLVEYAEGIRGESTSRSLVYDAVETLLVLAYSNLVIDDNSTYKQTFAYLERCLPLIGIVALDDIQAAHIELSRHESISRVVSAFYNLGGLLFNSGRAAEAMRFSRRACQVGDVAMRFAKREEGESLQKFYTRLRLLASRRWELLALTLYSTNKQAAFDAQVSAIANQTPQILQDLSQTAATSPLSTVLLRQASLYSLIQRATKLATFDLLLGLDACVLERLQSFGNLDRSAAGAVIEIQIASLEQNLGHEDSVKPIHAMLDALLVLYVPEDYPLRRARTLLRQMQQQCSPASSSMATSISARGEEIEELCSQKSFGLDEGLRSFASQYRAFSHIWIGFHAHSNRIVDANKATVKAAKLALGILRKIVDMGRPGSPPLSKHSSPVAPIVMLPTPPRTTRTTRRTANAKAPSSTKTPTITRTVHSRSRVNQMVTPPRRSVIDLAAATSAEPKADEAGVILDDLERCYATLETMANLLGVLGYSLLRISYLKLLRRLSLRTSYPNDSTFISASIQLGREYLRLGKTSQAGSIFAHAESRIRTGQRNGNPIPLHFEILFYTHYAEYLAICSTTPAVLNDKSFEIYNRAQNLDNSLREADSTTLRVVERLHLIQRAAAASSAYSVILQCRGDLSASLVPAANAFQYWKNALANLTKLGVTTAAVGDDEATFTSITKDSLNTPPDHVTALGPQPLLAGANSALAWQTAESLGSASIRIASLYLLQGTPKSAEGHILQSVAFARDIGSSRLLAQALGVRVEIAIQIGELDRAQGDLNEMGQLLGESLCPESIHVHRLRADLALQRNSRKEAHMFYVEAQNIFEAFAHLLEGEDANSSNLQSPSNLSASRSPRSTSTGPHTMLTSVLAHILRMRVPLLRAENKKEDSRQLLTRLASLVMTQEDQAEEFKLLALIRLEDLLMLSHRDPILDTVLSMPPLGPEGAKAKPRSSNLKSKAVNAKLSSTQLKEVGALLKKAIALSVSRVGPAVLRDLCLMLADVGTLQAAIGSGSQPPAEIAYVLDLGLAVALRREMLSATESKLQSIVVTSGHQWPFIEKEDSDSAEAGMEGLPINRYWKSIRERYRTESAAPCLAEAALSTLLPPHWSTISLHLTSERDCFILVRHRKDEQPMIFKLPLGRQARREADDEEFLTYDDAQSRLREIIEANDRTCSEGKKVTSPASRNNWWKERVALDVALGNLLLEVENTWLGAFTSLFLVQRINPLSTEFASFKTRIEDMLRIVQGVQPTVCKLDDKVLAALAELTPVTAREEDLEDLLYFITDSLQLSLDESDVDDLVVNHLKVALQKLHNATASPVIHTDEHTFLILDRSVQEFPWESIPCLRGRSVSRLPSLSFLRDRIDLAAVLNPGSSTPEITVNSGKTSYLLDPTKHFLKTQEAFQPWLESRKDWRGAIARAPDLFQMKKYLTESELFLFFGHGDCVDYISSKNIRHLPRCAVTMLWGCGSGLLKSAGDHDPSGTPYNYLVAGSPAFVGTLWSVTTNDIDLFATTVFKKTGLWKESGGTRASLPTMTLTQAVGSTRDTCRLKYLNGGATVVYGIPVRFT